MEKNWIKGLGLLLIVAVMALHIIVALGSVQTIACKSPNPPISTFKKVELIFKK